MGSHSSEYSERRSRAVCAALEIVMRVLALLLSVAGAVVMAKDKQVTTVYFAAVPVQFYARHSYVKALIFLVYANGIVAIYSLLALLVRFLARGRIMAGFLFLMDQALSYVLLAAAAASTEVAYIAKRGDEKVSWSEVCSNFERFCNMVGVSLVLTFLAVLAMAAVAVVSGRRLFGRGGGQPSASNPQL